MSKNKILGIEKNLGKKQFQVKVQNKDQKLNGKLTSLN